MKKIGRQVNFIGTTENNQRNGEGAFIKLKNGSIMFGYTEFIGNDWDDDFCARISYTLSDDNGETWSDKKILFEKPKDAKNIMSLSFLRMNNDDLGAFYIFKNLDGTDKIVFTRSEDEGITWSEPVNCMQCLEEQDYFVLNNDRVLRLSNGRILFSVAKHTVLNTDKDFEPGEIHFFYSDDDGKSWVKTDVILKCPFPQNPDGYEEPGLYQLSDGRIWCYIRTGLGFQYECFSEDFGLTWTLPEPNLFFSSACSPMLVKDCGIYTTAIFNPIPEHILRRDSEPWGRTPFVMAVSFDKGKTFDKENMFYIEDDLNNGYCYPAIYADEEFMLVAYYHSNNTGICLNSTKIIKIMYDELNKNG